MNLVRGQNYSAAGFTGSEHEKFQINPSVYVLDGTAGRGYDTYDGSDVKPLSRTRGRAYGISGRQMAWVLGVLAFVMGIWLVVNAIHIGRLASQVDDMNDHVSALKTESKTLDQELVVLRDMTHISTLAVINYHMIPMENAPVHEVDLPDMRPFSSKE